MIEKYYLARQAIVDNNESIMGYELLYRDGAETSNFDNPRHATAALLVNVLNQAGLSSIVGKQLAFINIEDSFLQHDFIESIPPKTFIFELTATASFSERFIESIQRLHNKKYVFSMDVNSYDNIEVVKSLAPYLFFVKIDSSSFETKYLKRVIEELKEHSIIIIASKVENVETFELYQKAGCDAYQGYFFAKPKIIEEKKLNTKQITLSRLCNVIQSGASIPEITQAFQQSPEITLQLLQFINSAAFHFRDPISSIQQVVTLLGRNSLMQWLMLLLYSKSFSAGAKFHNPLIVMVKQRTLIMVNLMKIIKTSSSQKEQSEAYFVGALSLIDALMQVHMEEVLSEFHVDKQVEEALFNKSGFLGELYGMALAVENFDLTVINGFLGKYKIDKVKFDNMILEVFKQAVEPKEE